MNLRKIFINYTFALLFISLPFIGTNKLIGYEPNEPIAAHGGHHGGGGGGGGHHGGGGSHGGGGHHGGGMHHPGSTSRSHHPPSRTHTPTHHTPKTHHTPQTHHTPKTHHPKWVDHHVPHHIPHWIPPSIDHYPPTYISPPTYEPPVISVPPSYTPPTYIPPPTYEPPPPTYQPPTTITIIIIIDGNEIPIDVPPDVIDSGTVIEVDGGDGTTIYVVPCNEDNPPADSPTGDFGYWQYVDALPGQPCGYWQWIPTDEQGNPPTTEQPPPEETPPPEVTPPPEETPTDTTTIVIVTGDGTEIILTIPIDVIDSGTVIEVPVDGTIIDIVPCNEDNPPTTAPTDSTGYWQWVPAEEAICNGYWLWIPTDEQGNPTTTIIDIFNPPGTTVIQPPVVTPTDTATVTIVIGDGSVIELIVPIDVIDNGTVIEVPVDGTIIYIVPCNENNPPFISPTDGYGNWQWIPGLEGICGYWLWIPTDAQGNPSSTIIDIFNPPSSGITTITGVEGSTAVVLPGDISIAVTGGDGNSVIVTITDSDGTSSSLTVPAARLASVITIPLSDGNSIDIQLGAEGNQPRAAPSDSPSGQWVWIAATQVSKGYWLWVPTGKGTQYKVPAAGVKQKTTGHLEKAAGQHMKWVPSGKAVQQQKVSQKQKDSKGHLEKVSSQKGKTHMKWVSPDKQKASAVKPATKPAAKPTVKADKAQKVKVDQQKMSQSKRTDVIKPASKGNVDQGKSKRTQLIKPVS